MIKDNYNAEVDLKWSLWSATKDGWEEYAPGVWDWMRQWFDANTDPGNPEAPELSDAPRVVYTAPRKEIRFGEVEFQPGQAKIHFYSEFDDGGSEHVSEVIEAETFEELMKAIDDCEARLIKLEEAY